ncbi:hypothetical protein CEP52_008118 [Fusarium oligoseptatum]|uniref:Uncharacterized protein n=1 Tax=Fusarium oligoseptatum TaxID=2604345 RepID=A0A428TJA8_9HYPO|nr:hypothetical protein CEP52_008118 [Fusarium oligoseptatum]
MTMTSGGQAPSITVTGQRHEAKRRHWRERGEKPWSAWNGHLPEEFQVGSPSHRPIMSGLELSRFLKTALRVRLGSSVVRITGQTMAVDIIIGAPFEASHTARALTIVSPPTS